MLRIFLIFSGIASILLSKAFACSCSEITAKDMLTYEFNKYIFTGIVTSAKLMKHKGVYSYINVDVMVDERFKGLTDEKTFNVNTNLSESSCGGPVSVGTPYLFVTDARGFFTFCTSMSMSPSDMDQKARVYIEGFRDLTKQK